MFKSEKQKAWLKYNKPAVYYSRLKKMKEGKTTTKRSTTLRKRGK
jgi:hypothetical protein